MYYLMLLAAVAGIAASFGMGKAYQSFTKETFGVVLRKIIPMSLLEGLLFWGMNGFQLHFSGFSFWMALVISLVAIISAVVAFFGYANGSIAVFTMFQMVGGMLLPFIYGIWYGNEVTAFRVVGIILLLASVLCPFFGQKENNASVRKLTPKFLALCVSIFFLNGGISIISYIHSNSEAASDANSYLIMKALITTGICLLLFVGYLLTPKGRGDLFSNVTPTVRIWMIVLLVGMSVADGVSYYLQLISAEYLPAVALYPIVTGGTMILTALVGRLFFREKISRMSAIGIGLAFVATFLFMF